MPEIKTTREDLRAKQRERLAVELERATEVTGSAVSRVKQIVDELFCMEENRSISDLIHDLIQDAGGGEEGGKEIAYLLQEIILEESRFRHCPLCLLSWDADQAPKNHCGQMVLQGRVGVRRTVDDGLGKA